MAVIVADGVIDGGLSAIVEQLAAEGAVPVMMAQNSDACSPIAASRSRSARRSRSRRRWCRCLLLPDGEAAAAALAANGRVLEFVKDTYRDCKPILALEAASNVLEAGAFR